MATAIGLAMQLSASTSGLSAGLSEAERLIQKLGRGAESAAGLFNTFRDAVSGQLPAAMQVLVDSAGSLTQAFRDGWLNSEEFAAGLADLSTQSSLLTKTFQEGAAITKQYQTEEEKRAATIAKLDELLSLGAINQATYAAALADASGANKEAQAAEAALAKARADAAQIIEGSLSAQEKYDATILNLNSHLEAGRLTQEQYDKAAAKAADTLDKASKSTEDAGNRAEEAGLKFNELSGFFSLLPGPIGNVAGRISGFASTINGVEKLIANPSNALEGLGKTFETLTSPVGLAVVGIAAFGAAATAITKNLLALSDQVQQLGREADKLGASFEFVQVLDEAAKRSGSSLSAVGNSFKAFLQSVNEAGDSSNKASEKVRAAFESIGVSAEDLAAQSPEELYKRVASALTEIEDPARRAAVAQELLGKQGLALLPTFRGIADTEKDMKRYFATLSDFDKIRFDALDASVSALKTSTSGLGRALITPFTGLGDGIARGSAEFVGGITAIVKPIGQVLEPFLTNIGRVIETFLSGLGAIGRTIGAVLQPFGTVFSAISESISPAYDAFQDFTAAVQGTGEAVASFIVSFTPIGIIADNIGAIQAAVKPFVDAFVQGISKVVEYGERIGTIVVAAFQKFYEAVVEYIGGTIQTITESVAAFLEYVGIADVISSVLSAIGGAFGGLWDTIKGIISGIGGFIESVLTFAEDWLGIKRNVEEPVQAEIKLDTTEPALAAAQFYDEISKAVERASALGTEGFDAAVKYQSALEEIAQLQAEGTYTEEEAKRAVEQATAALDAQLKPLEEQAKARQKAADEAQRAAEQQIEADRKAADAILEQQRLIDEFGGDQKRAKAAEELLVIEREIARVQEAQKAAAAASDASAESAAAARLAALDQAKAAAAETAEFGFNQQDIDAAVDKVRSELEQTMTQAEFDLAPDAAANFFDTIDSLAKQLDLKLIDPKQFEEASKAAKKTFDDAVKQAQKVRDLEIKYSDEVAKIDQERLQELGKLSTETLKANDIRSSEGASTYMALATGKQDPAIEEYRKQIKKLDEIKKEIAKARNPVVEIA